jgi:hypothetical protein
MSYCKILLEIDHFVHRICEAYGRPYLNQLNESLILYFSIDSKMFRL